MHYRAHWEFVIWFLYKLPVSFAHVLSVQVARKHVYYFKFSGWVGSRMWVEGERGRGDAQGDGEWEGGRESEKERSFIDNHQVTAGR